MKHVRLIFTLGLTAFLLAGCEIADVAEADFDPTQTESDIFDPGPIDITNPTPTNPDQFFDFVEIVNWYKSNLPRGEFVTRGDLPTFKRQRNSIPVGEGSNFKTVICAGAGCPIKMPFTFTRAHLETVAKNMAAERVSKNCLADTPECERVALSRGVVDMEMIMYNEKLRTLPHREYQAYSIEDHVDYGSRLTQDCVDQATNGITYLYIFAHYELIKHHRIIYPGRINLAVVQPHFFTRIQDSTGKILRFDLYHRGRFGIPPYIACMNCP